MNHTYGMNRVLEPLHVLPTSAWKLDNSRKLQEGEMRVDIKTIHLEGTSFKQICLEANNDDQKIKQKIFDIVIRRGKLHNPVTDTGGLFYGVVSEIEEGFKNPKGFQKGDQVICNASLASVPIYIDRITGIDRAFGQIDVDGYAIICNDIPMVKKPEGLPINLLLFTFNESGTLYRVSNAAVGKRKVLIVGNNLLSNLIFGYAVRKVAREGAEIVCLLDKKSDVVLKGESIDRLIRMIFTQFQYVDILKPMECMGGFRTEALFDLSVNCADIPGAETINILATKSGGTVVFANLINNYNISLYITESISKELDIRYAEGYHEAYDAFDIEMVKELVPYIENAEKTSLSVEDKTNHMMKRQTRLMEASRQRQTVLEDFICESSAMVSVLNEMITVSKYDCNVLITGDTGVGKEKVANIIYKNSNRNMHPFIKINCASIAPSRIETEFFGKETDPAVGVQGEITRGYFELADNGVIFLDEVSELEPEIQAKLLRVVQDGEFFRVGGTVPVKTNVRIISATTRNLEELMDDSGFRRDLYYRLNVVHIKIPNLKERVGDIPALIEHFMKKYEEKFNIKRTIDADAVEYMKQCPWSGNIRELDNVIQRVMISAAGEQITLIDVMRELHKDVFEEGENISNMQEDENGQVMDLEKIVQNFEKNVLKYACEQYGSTRKVAKAIGISQTQLVRKKKKYNI